MKTNLLTLICIGIAAIFNLTVHAQSVLKSTKVYMFDDEICTGAAIYGVSNNGEYAVGFSSVFTKQSFIWKRSTGQVYLIDGSEEDQSEAYDVADDGTVVGCFKDPYSLDVKGSSCLVPGYWKNGEWTKLETMPGLPFAGGDMDGAATAISADGKIISGFIRVKAGDFSPVIWKNDKLEPIFEQELLGQGAASFCMSDDATVLGGWAEHDSGARSAAVWVNGEMTRITGETWDEHLYDYWYSGQVTDISPNGQYVVGYWSEDGVYMCEPFIWTKEKGRNYIADNGMSMAVLDDGTIYGTSAAPAGTAFIYKDEKMQTILSYIQDNYNYEGEQHFGCPMRCSADGKVIGGWNLIVKEMGEMMTPWIIVLEETVNGIDNSQTSSLNVAVKERTLTFNGEVSQISISDLAGNTVYSGCPDNGTLYHADHLAKGIYILTFSNLQGMHKTQKIILN